MSKALESALRFFAWIRQGIADGTLKYNAPEARIHFVEEGMLLVSPGTFRQFAAASVTRFCPAVRTARTARATASRTRSRHEQKKPGFSEKAGLIPRPRHPTFSR